MAVKVHPPKLQWVSEVVLYGHLYLILLTAPATMVRVTWEAIQLPDPTNKKARPDLTQLVCQCPRNSHLTDPLLSHSLMHAELAVCP